MCSLAMWLIPNEIYSLSVAPLDGAKWKSHLESFLCAVFDWHQIYRNLIIFKINYKLAIGEVSE